MTHNKQVVELELNSDLPNSKFTLCIIYNLELVVERGVGRRRILEVKRMETTPGKGLEVDKEKATQRVFTGVTNSC